MSDNVYDFDQPLNAPKPFVQLPEGIVSFVVAGFSRIRRTVKAKGKELNGGNPIWVAVLNLKCRHEDGEEGDIEVDLPLHDVYMFRLWQFFTAIGQREHGEDKQFMPDWNKVEGSTGYAVIKHTKGKTKRDDGEYPLFVNLDKFMTKAEMQEYREKREAAKEEKAEEKKNYF